jgi:hypothetical protein
MLAINPLLPFFPDYLSFLIYGLITGGVLRFWSIAKRHFVFMVLYFAPCVFWLIVMWAFMSVQPESRQIWFGVGVVVAFMKPFAMLYALFGFIFERVMERIQEARQERREQQWREPPPQDDRGYQRGWSNADILAEQARREAEARANRARQGQGGSQSEPPPQDRIKDKSRDKPKDPPKPPQSSPENRSYEQILGLPLGWTQEDLKNAYKRESNRTHPDKWIGKPEQIRQVMEAEFKAIQKAYNKLKR